MVGSLQQVTPRQQPIRHKPLRWVVALSSTLAICAVVFGAHLYVQGFYLLRLEERFPNELEDQSLTLSGHPLIKLIPREDIRARQLLDALVLVRKEEYSEALQRISRAKLDGDARLTALVRNLKELKAAHRRRIQSGEQAETEDSEALQNRELEALTESNQILTEIAKPTITPKVRWVYSHVSPTLDRLGFRVPELKAS